MDTWVLVHWTAEHSEPMRVVQGMDDDGEMLLERLDSTRVWTSTMTFDYMESI